MSADRRPAFRSLFLPSREGPRDAPWRPAIDVHRTADGWIVKFDLAGVHPEDVNLSVAGTRLTARGRRRDVTLGEECRCYVMEINYSQFERTIELPADLDRAAIEAEHRDGMVLVRIRTEGNRS